MNIATIGTNTELSKSKLAEWLTEACINALQYTSSSIHFPYTTNIKIKRDTSKRHDTVDLSVMLVKHTVTVNLRWNTLELTSLSDGYRDIAVESYKPNQRTKVYNMTQFIDDTSWITKGLGMIASDILNTIERD